MKLSTSSSLVLTYIAGVAHASDMPPFLADMGMAEAGGVGAAEGDGISVGSDLGRALLSQARRLDNDDGYSYAWIENYSIKFQGCHHIAQWNDNAEGGNNQNGDMYDVKIRTRRLARFRLCPTNSCSSNGSYGCKDGYGDYVVDLSLFTKAYYESKRRARERECEMYLWKKCDCDDEDGNERGDDFNRDYCEYDCYIAAGMNDCVDQNPYEEDNGNNNRRDEADRYMECSQLKNNNRRGRELENNGNNQYYVGPYCAEGGSKVFLGVFQDDTCSQYADSNYGRTTYASLVGSDLPYSSTSVVGMECFSCQEGQDVNKLKENEQYYAQYGYYPQDNDQNENKIADQCEGIYGSAGKCEELLADGVTSTPVNNACTYIQGIRITRQSEDGVIMGQMRTNTNAVATGFIVFFALAFASLGMYVLYLRKNLGKAIHLDS